MAERHIENLRGTAAEPDPSAAMAAHAAHALDVIEAIEASWLGGGAPVAVTSPAAALTTSGECRS